MHVACQRGCVRVVRVVNTCCRLQWELVLQRGGGGGNSRGWGGSPETRGWLNRLLSHARGQ